MVQWKSVLLLASSNLLSSYLEGNLEMLESFEMDWRAESGESYKKLLDSIDQTSMNPPDAQGHWGSTSGRYGTGMVETLPRSGVFHHCFANVSIW